MRYPARSIAGGILFAAVGMQATMAQQAPAFEPKVGQRGKDVVWVPTNQLLVDKMLDMAKVTPSDHVIDLGSGDGRTVITAAKRGATAHGIEYNADMVELSKRNAVKEGVADRATFEKADLFESDFSRATVVTMFLLPNINLKLMPKLLNMKPGTRVVSNSFGLGDWRPDETVSLGEECPTHCTAYFWVVPAKVEGNWQTPQGELALRQTFQDLKGTLTQGNVVAPVSGKVAGTGVEFTAAGVRYSGTLNGDVIAGKRSANGKEEPWTAKR